MKKNDLKKSLMASGWSDNCYQGAGLALLKRLTLPLFHGLAVDPITVELFVGRSGLVHVSIFDIAEKMPPKHLRYITPEIVEAWIAERCEVHRSRLRTLKQLAEQAGVDAHFIAHNNVLVDGVMLMIGSVDILLVVRDKRRPYLNGVRIRWDDGFLEERLGGLMRELKREQDNGTGASH